MNGVLSKDSTLFLELEQQLDPSIVIYKSTLVILECDIQFIQNWNNGDSDFKCQFEVKFPLRLFTLLWFCSDLDLNGRQALFLEPRHAFAASGGPSAAAQAGSTGGCDVIGFSGRRRQQLHRRQRGGPRVHGLSARQQSRSINLFIVHHVRHKYWCC